MFTHKVTFIFREHSNNRAMVGIHGIININKYVDMDTGMSYIIGERKVEDDKA